MITAGTTGAPPLVVARHSDRTLSPFLGALERSRATVTELQGWRRYGVAFLLGAMAVAALPPLHVWPAVVPAFMGLYWLIDSAQRRRGGLWAGWWFGAGYFVFGLYWVVNAFIVRGGGFIWAGPFAVVGLAALLACFPAVAGGATRWLRWRGIGGIVVFAAAWTVAEWLRGWVLTGFPWNLVGTIWTASDPMMQVTAVIGTLGLSLVTVAAASIPAALADPALSWRRGVLATGIATSVLVVSWAGGAARLAAAGDTETVPGIYLRLIQPSIPQEQKWRRDELDAHLVAQLKLGYQGRGTGGEAAPTHVIWGETAAPLFLAEDPERLALIGRFTPPGGLTILGTLRRTPDTESLQIWNSLYAVNDQGAIVGTYDKSHLVPFGEYVPLRSWLGFAKVTTGSTDFSSGDGPTTLDLPGLPPASPLICYEVIFPGRVTEPSRRPDWLLNLTNDAWYGISPGPYQHFAAARLRAVEEGLPLVRVANSGVSAIVDPFGRTVASLDLGKVGSLDGPLPRPLAAPTPYARFGDGVVLVMVLAAGLIGWRFSHGA
ncbi:MAG: apolipoprotein N-acyltransferase [Rhodospirillales bacterium]|nr:apolipoprotein N-acyltransferase [Rhodospirillales bacterium]